MGNAKKEDCFKIRVELIFILLTIVTIASCTSAKQLRYFSDLPDSTTIHLPLMPSDERLMQIGDRLQISIGARDQAAAEVFNRYGGIIRFFTEDKRIRLQINVEKSKDAQLNISSKLLSVAKTN